MAVLPRFLAGTPPPRESGLARATDIGALTRTGDIEVWRGVSRFGGAIQGAGELGFDAYQRRRSLDDIIEEGIATQRAQESFNQAEDAAELIDVTADMPDPNDPDYMKTLTSFSTTKRDTLFADAVKDIEEDAKKLSQGFSNPANKARFENWYNKNYTRFADRVRHMYDAKLDAYQQAALDKLVEDAAKNGDTKIANFYIDVMDKFELLTPQQAAARKEQVEKIAAESLALSYINEAATMASEMPYKDAITFLNKLPLSTIFTKADRTGLITQRERQNEIETATTNKEVYWNTLRKIDTISDDDLEALVKPDSLTWDDAIKLKKIRDTENDPLKSPRAQLYFEKLKAAFPDREKDTEEEGRRQALQWDIGMEKLTAFLKTNPTAKDAAEFYADLVEDEKKAWLEKLWSSLWTLKPPLWQLAEKTAEVIPILGKGELPKEEAPAPKSQQEYDALPSGAVYIDTDGVKKRKR